MSENTITEAMAADAPAATPKLNAALAKVQAEMPPIGKDGTGKISGIDKNGKPFSYTYNYADLAAICAVAYPITGKHCLSFSSQPTLNKDGRFVLEYQLRHESGEQAGGSIPLPSAGKPQELGSVLTYYKRYAFTAVTGIAPGGEDNDAATANHAQQYDGRGDQSWRDQPPVNLPVNQGPGREVTNGNGHAPAAAEPQAEQPDAATIAEWGALIDTITSQEDADKADEELKGIFTEGKISPATANAIRGAIKAKAASLGSREESRQPTAEVLAWAQRIEDAADIAALRAVNEEAKTARKLSASYMREGKPVTLSQRIGARRAEIEARMASVPA